MRRQRRRDRTRLRTSAVAGPLPLAHDLVESRAAWWCKPVAGFFVRVPRESSACSRFLFFGAGATGAREEVLAERAWASAAARALVLMGAEYIGG